MKKMKLIAVAGSLVMASSLLATPVVNASEYISGTNCMAANLNQALQGIGWSQGGVKNNSTSPFFVVCPVDLDTLGLTTVNAITGATFPGSGTVECTARSQNLIDNSYNSASFTVTAGQLTGNPNSGYNFTPIDFSGSRVNNTIVCALDPGEGIAWVAYE